MDLLTNSGWSPVNSIESILIQIRTEMVEGGGRLDLNNQNPYTVQEAKVFFFFFFFFFLFVNCFFVLSYIVISGSFYSCRRSTWMDSSPYAKSSVGVMIIIDLKYSFLIHSCWTCTSGFKTKLAAFKISSVAAVIDQCP